MSHFQILFFCFFQKNHEFSRIFRHFCSKMAFSRPAKVWKWERILLTSVPSCIWQLTSPHYRAESRKTRRNSMRFYVARTLCWYYPIKTSFLWPRERVPIAKSMILLERAHICPYNLIISLRRILSLAHNSTSFWFVIKSTNGCLKKTIKKSPVKKFKVEFLGLQKELIADPGTEKF